MKQSHFFAACLLAFASASAQAAPASSTTQAIPRDKITLTCSDSYFKAPRQNFLLSDEVYPNCTLKMPLALTDRWPGRRTFYVIPRISASLHSTNAKGEGRWQPLMPLVMPGNDPLHGTLSSEGYKAVELSGKMSKLVEVAGENKPDTVSAGGKMTVCVAPVYRGEEPCQTYDVAARFRVYLH